MLSVLTHTHGLVLQPENIIFASDPVTARADPNRLKVKLIDLGMAANLDASNPIKGECWGSMPHCQLVLGSSGSMYACCLKLCVNPSPLCIGHKAHFLQLHFAVRCAICYYGSSSQLQFQLSLRPLAPTCA